MDNRLFAFFLFLAACTRCWTFEKLNPRYQITYGDISASIQVTEYISFNCPRCLDFFREDFPQIKQKYIDTKQVVWTFHPDPADLATLQAMVCLDQLYGEQKRLFFEAVFTHVNLKNSKQASLVMEAAMKVLSSPVSQLKEIEFLKNTEAFDLAYKFLKQEDVVTRVPTIEINGKIHDRYPNRRFIEETLDALLKKGSSHENS